MNWELIKNELRVNYKSLMNTHMNDLHLSCESGVHDSISYSTRVRFGHMQLDHST